MTYVKSRIDFNHIINTFINVETRYIEISLDTAKRLYEQGGEYRDIALTAFKEHELIGDRLPKTWDEYCAKYGEVGDKIKASLNTAYMTINKHTFSDYNQAQAHIAMIKLHLLRDEYRNGWLPSWEDSFYKYGIKWNMIAGKTRLVIAQHTHDSDSLSFPTYELAEEFLTNFRELIEDAGDLI